MPTSRLRKLLYRIGLLTPFWRIDRTRYLKRLARRKVEDWRYVAKDDAAQFAGSEVVARLMGVSAPVFFYCDRNSSSIEADILKSTKVESGTLKQRWRVLELGMDLISPGSCVIDVGANIGIYALPWAAGNADVTVHCFEPSPGVRSRLARNVALNRLTARIRMHAEALSDHAGTATLYGSDDMSSLNRGFYTGASEPVSTEVPLVRLDDILGIEGLPISLVKVDVQGHELEVLQGAEAVISRHRPALILEHEDDLYLSASEANQRKTLLAKLLSRLGYETLYISRWGPELLTVVDWSRRLNGDLLALPMDNQARTAS
ncbi:MAG TPA: FkbM family methyltransferase [Burkholderiales bacterium]|nr:FkbM family methyltransferase [Burkholderiales bacterium]